MITLNTKIHSAFHMLKAILGSTLAQLVPAGGDQLIVLNYHGTPEKYLDNFRKQLEYLKKNYEVISPAQFYNFMDGKEKVNGKKILLTFDDGIKNNLKAIAVLDEMGLSACFFIVPGFIDTLFEDQKEYFIKNIRPLINPEIDSEAEDFSAMSWAELSEVSKKHAIGCHTFSHTMVKDRLDMEQLEKELLFSKNEIERNLNCSIDSFCSINNTLFTIGKTERQIIESNYSYHFTTFGGNNVKPDPFLIKRINVESHWLKGAFKFALSAFELNRWKTVADLFQSTTR